MSHRVQMWCGVGLLLFGTVALGAWMRSSQEEVIPTDPLPPIVRLVEIQSGEATESRSFPAFVKESVTADLAFRVPGPIQEMDVTIGRKVTAGTVLAKLDPRDFELAVQRAEAGLAEAEAGLRAMRTGARVEDIAMLESKVRAADSQLDTAKLQWERMDRLFREETAPKAQYDVAKTQYDQAVAQSEAAHKELEKAKTGARPEEIEAMEAKIAGIRVQLATARNALADSVLTAPFDGFVSQKYVESHEMVAAGTPVLSFTDTSVLEVTSSIPEEMVLRQEDFRKFHCEFEAY
ncbi:MAG: HlyD family efflux transporter periplasmic adaptor subunit, partial [Planctomycetia bacterium]|nr:HlyD family efflux transporter periplasmic adaptor subunit [Planctomycetia bacterium]